MVTTNTKNVLVAALIAAALVLTGASSAFAISFGGFGHHEHDNDGDHSLYTQCHNGIDDDEDGYIDLLDNDCAQYRPICGEGQHSDAQFNCVPDEEGDPVCEAPQVLVEHECVDPQPLQCEAPQVPNEAQTECVTPAPTCVGEQTLVENQCVDPVCAEGQTLNTETHMCVAVAPTCVGEQTLVENQCVEPVCSEGQTLNTETHMCVSPVVVVTCTADQHLEGDVCVANQTPPASGGGGNSGGGGGNGPIVGSLGGGGSIVPGGNGPIAGQVLGANTSNLPELPNGCSALLSSYMRMGKHNDSEDVKKLQQFLNKELGLDLPVTGFFGRDTDAGVRKFQLAHMPQILTPWGISDATGYVYKTTQRWINISSCQSLDIPMPELN